MTGWLLLALLVAPTALVIGCAVAFCVLAVVLEKLGALDGHAFREEVFIREEVWLGAGPGRPGVKVPPGFYVLSSRAGKTAKEKGAS